MLSRGRLLVQCVKRNDEPIITADGEEENRIFSPIPGPSFLTEVNMTEPSFHMPTDLDSTQSMSVINDSVSHTVAVFNINEERYHDSTMHSIETNATIDSVDYEHDFNHLLVTGTDRISTPKEYESPLDFTNFSPSNVTLREYSVIVGQNDIIDKCSKSARKAANQEKQRDVKTTQQKEKHPINLKNCSNCPNTCSQFSEEMRREIWKKYWELNYTDKRKWLASCIKTVSIQRRRVTNTQERGIEFRKKASRTYFFKKYGKDQRVCLSFLLKTLGYSSDSVITEISKAMKKAPLLMSVKENRGRKKGKLCNHKLIEDHINSFHPVVAHYRRHNTPNMRYLPPGLTVNQLFDDFKAKHPNTCSKETYRKVIKDLGISLKTPECDVCGDCAIFGILKGEYEEKREVMPEHIKEKQEKHKAKATEAIDEYKNDSKVEENSTLKIFSMDLQKVLLIPHMPKVKDAFFVSRLIAFNETFASLKKNAESYCIVWHEGLAGRDAPQIIDAITTFLREERDINNFIIWMDNCCAQNKNWFLYTGMVNIVNSSIVSQNLQSITFKYLTKGHTHMSADGVHGNIEKQMRKTNVYDFRDLEDTMKKARSNMKVVTITEFRNWQKKKRNPRKDNDELKDFVLKNVVAVKFERGTRQLMFKESFLEPSFKDLNFLQPRFDITKIPEEIGQHRGIDSAKKKTIIDKLVKLMPSNRTSFWKNIPETPNAEDLVDSGQLICEYDD